MKRNRKPLPPPSFEQTEQKDVEVLEESKPDEEDLKINNKL